MSASEFRRGGIRKHSSTDSYNYFRGTAVTVEILRFLELSAFYSHRSMDGVVKGGKIASIYKTGLHRTEKEADKMNAFVMQSAGGNLTYEKNRLKVGVTGIYYRFNHPYEPDLKKYAKYNLHGNDFYNLGVDYKYRWGKLVWVGEGAVGKQGYALLNQLKYRLLTGYQLLLIHRCYSHDYWSFFGRSFGEGSAPQNENGWYLATEAAPWAHWKFFASLDMFSFPWWKYRISKASQGIDGMFQAAYSPQKNLLLYLNYRYKRKERDVSGTGGKVTLPVFHHKLRCSLLIRRELLHVALRSITIIFASRVGKDMSLKENKAGNVPSPALILFPDSLWPYPYKVLISIRTITIRGFMLPKKDWFIRFILLLSTAVVFAIPLIYVVI